jgi:hypothetical protein
MKRALTEFTFAVIAAIALVLAGGKVVEAYTTSPAGITPTVSYTEPGTLVNLDFLTDLKETRIKWSLDGGPTTVVVVPATSGTGGQAITNTSILAPVLACQTKTLHVRLSAVRLANLAESADSPTVDLVVDRTKLATGQPDPNCTPKAPTGLTVQ